MEKKHYRLIAFDMDGTLLNSEKKISPAVLDSIRKAQESGKMVVLATGRTVTELAAYRGALDGVAYGVCESGGMIYDFKNEKAIWRSSFTPEILRRIEEIARTEDVIPLAMENGGVCMEATSYEALERHQVAHFAKLFAESARIVEDLWKYIRSGGEGFEKINLYHTDVEAREMTRKKFGDLPVELADSERTSLEISPEGVCKGNALKRLCDILGIPVAESIAVGDADNDLTMLRAAGLAVAMGNANERVKAAAGAIVADNDHDGCKEAIERFLMD